MYSGESLCEEIIADLQEQNITVRRHPYLDYALEISGYNYIKAIRAFKKGWIQVQDVSSMLVAEIAAPNWGDYCIDVCAAPGGKSLHISEKLRGSGFVEARDISEHKVKLMQENIERTGAIKTLRPMWRTPRNGTGFPITRRTLYWRMCPVPAWA